jgi:hypothetical protein
MDFKTVNEKKRSYDFGNGNLLTFENVESICVRPSGTHRLNLKDGKKVIVKNRWLAIAIDGEWVF